MSLLLLRPVRPERENVCVMPDCMELTHGRGLCRIHYHRARYLVWQGCETWESLEACGYAVAPKARRYDRPISERMRAAIAAIHERGEYPSARAINRELGRRYNVLDSRECAIRNAVFAELGITVKHRGAELSLRAG